MTITLIMDDRKLESIEQVEAFTTGAAPVDFCGASAKEKYAWVEATLIRFRYGMFKKKDRGAIRRLIAQYLGC